MATHGRALWILDHLEPIQEYTAAQSADAKLSRCDGPAVERQDDRNDEFWDIRRSLARTADRRGDQFNLKRTVTNPMLRITAESGRQGARVDDSANAIARDSRRCVRDQRVQADHRGGRFHTRRRVLSRAAAGAVVAVRRSGRAGVVVAARYPHSSTTFRLGHMAENPSAAWWAEAAGRGGAGPNAGPHVMHGPYTSRWWSTVLRGGRHQDDARHHGIRRCNSPDTRARRRYNDILMDLHGLQQRDAPTWRQFWSRLHREMLSAAPKVAPEQCTGQRQKREFAAFSKEFDAVRAKFG